MVDLLDAEGPDLKLDIPNGKVIKENYVGKNIVNYDSMLVYDDWTHTSYVSYQGTTGKQYKAYVCIWAGKNGGGDTRYMWATM